MNASRRRIVYNLEKVLQKGGVSNMRYRQINLDFHTSEKLKNIGRDFSKENFQEALRVGHVDSITVFSKCHHGWSYHPTKTNIMHPGLSFDLLGEQIKAAHEIGVKTPVYLSAGLDEKEVKVHPQWAYIGEEDYTQGIINPLEQERVGYHVICLNTPYLDKLLTQIREVLESYDADGIFLDIVGVRPCYCDTCKKQLQREGKDIENKKDVLELAERVYKNFTDRVRKTVDEIKPGLPVFYNGGHIRQGRRDLAYMNSHLELESLPTGGWGYAHFPVSASYARTLGMEYLGMTAKFHLSWGEFGGFKHPNALQYEIALSAANGAGSSIGDQLHPLGRMDMATYKMIGKAYERLEEIEPWLHGYENVAEIAVLSNESIQNYYTDKYERKNVFSVEMGKSDTGCARILLEGHYLFNYVDIEEDFLKYKVIILPDNIMIDEFLEEKIKKFLQSGGKILATGKSGLSEKKEFVFDFGCTYAGENPYLPDYFRPNYESETYENTAFVMYSQGQKICFAGGEILGYRENPYFNRSKEHFSSHQHTPNDPDYKEGAFYSGKDGIYIAWNVFEDYAVKGSFILKEMLLKALDRLLPNKSIQTNLPSQGIVTLTEKENIKVAHLLYASPIKRGENVEIIEDILPIYDTKVKIKTKQPKNVYELPEKKTLPFEYKEGYTVLRVSKFVCHKMILIEE